MMANVSTKGEMCKPLNVDGKRDAGAGAGRRWHFRAIDRAVERVALDGDAAGFADQAFEFGARGEFGGLGAGVVIDFFLDDGAVQVVRAKTQCDLRDAWREHYPIGFYVVDIVEQNARASDGF